MMDNTTGPGSASGHGLNIDQALSTLRLNPVSSVFVSLAIAVWLWYLTSYLASPLRKFPGPPLAAWTNYWRMYHAYRGSMHLVMKRVHDQYGPVVRTAPNVLDVDIPSLVKTCFDSKGVWRKTEWHGVSGVKVGPKIVYNLFSECDPVEHARIKKPVAKYFTSTGVAPMEPHVDRVVAKFVRVLGGMAGEAIDFSEWAMYFAWDAVSMTSVSQEIGYLDHGRDFDGTLHTSEKAMQYLTTVGMQPFLDRFLDKNPVVRIGPPTYASMTAVAVGHLVKRLTGEDKATHDAAAQPDFLDRYLEAKKLFPDVVDDTRVLAYMLSNFAAGADTTAPAMGSVVYLGLRHPRVWAKLEAEVAGARFERLPAPLAQARALPYLDAVVREALRLYPGNGFPSERYVPRGGLQLPDGAGFVPEGVAVGFSSYVIHRNKSVWGADADEFRPERWLRGEDESEDAYKARLTAMNNADLSFGQGSRKCIGQNVAVMEVFKVMATLLASFEFELADPDKEWELTNSLFFRQRKLMVKLRKREGVTLVDV